jgi:dephospho-CoA kinase
MAAGVPSAIPRHGCIVPSIQPTRTAVAPLGWCPVPSLAVLVIGLTGGIGAGKSTVAARLVARGAALIDGDTMAREVVAPGGPAYEAVVTRFGSAVVGPDGAIDRPALAAVVFADAAALADLNAITHPAIEATMLERVARHRGTDDVIVLDIPLLRADGRRRWGLDGVLVVDAPTEVAVARLVSSRPMSEADARARVAAQLTREERRSLADLVIDNGDGIDQLEAEIERAWAWILARRDHPDGAGA